MTTPVEFILLTATFLALALAWVFSIALSACPRGSRGRRVQLPALLVTTAALVAMCTYLIGTWAFGLVGVTVGAAVLVELVANRRRARKESPW
jgi:hypothetical protein